MAAFLLCNCECLLVALRDRNHEREFASLLERSGHKVVACPDDLWRYDPLQTSGVQRNRLSGCRTADVPADRPPRKRYPPILPRSRGDHMQLDRLKRREFITLIGGAAAWPLVAHAQPARRRPVVAFVHAVIPPAETGVIGTLETLVGHRRLRAGRSASAFCSIWRRTGSSMGERCSGGCAGKVPPAI